MFSFGYDYGCNESFFFSFSKLCKVTKSRISPQLPLRGLRNFSMVPKLIIWSSYSFLLTPLFCLLCTWDNMSRIFHTPMKYWTDYWILIFGKLKVFFLTLGGGGLLNLSSGIEKVWYPGILVTSQCQIWQPILAGPKALTATIWE